MPTVETFADTRSAFLHAKPKAVHGHKNWVVWVIANGTVHAARESADALVRAARDAVPAFGEEAVAVRVEANAGHFTNLSRGALELWRDNLEAGF